MAGATLEQREAEAERRRAITELRARREELAGKVAALDDSIAQLEDRDFKARLGHVKLSEMSVRQKSEVVARHGLDAFLGLLRR